MQALTFRFLSWSFIRAINNKYNNKYKELEKAHIETLTNIKMKYNINNRKRERLRTGKISEMIWQRADVRWKSVNQQMFITRESLRG